VLWTSSESYFEFYGLVMNCKSFARVFFHLPLSLSLSLFVWTPCFGSLFLGGWGVGSGALIISEAQQFASHSIVQIILKQFCALLDVFMNMRNDFKHWTWFVSLQTLHFTFKKKSPRACIM
jgi:hypothetical protein